LENSAADGLELPASNLASVGTGRTGHSPLEEEPLAGALKAPKEWRTIVFIDESRLNERPHRCRTRAPRGHTPVRQYHFNWKTLPAIAEIICGLSTFAYFPARSKGGRSSRFSNILLRHLPGTLLVIWDG
jgi:hypothetical protein